MLDKIIKDYSKEELLIVDGFDEAVIGIDFNSERLIYLFKKCVDILIESSMSEEDAIEYLSFCVVTAYVGENTPIWCKDDFQ